MTKLGEPSVGFGFACMMDGVFTITDSGLSYRDLLLVAHARLGYDSRYDYRSDGSKAECTECRQTGSERERKCSRSSGGQAQGGVVQRWRQESEARFAAGKHRESARDRRRAAVVETQTGRFIRTRHCDTQECRPVLVSLGHIDASSSTHLTHRFRLHLVSQLSPRKHFRLHHPGQTIPRQPRRFHPRQLHRLRPLERRAQLALFVEVQIVAPLQPHLGPTASPHQSSHRLQRQDQEKPLCH